MCVLSALGVCLIALSPAHAAPSNDGYRGCKALAAKPTVPATTDDFEQLDCFLDFVSDLTLDSNKGDVDESDNCASEASDDPPYGTADGIAALTRPAIQTRRSADERTYTSIDEYLGAKRSFYLAKYQHTAGTREKVDKQINLVGQKVKAFRDSERDFLALEASYADALGAHDCDGAKALATQAFLPASELGDNLRPAVNQASDKLLELIKLPARKKPAAKKPKPKDAGGKPKPKPKSGR